MKTHDVYAIGIPWNKNDDDSVMLVAKSKDALKRYIEYQNSIHNKIIPENIDQFIGPVRVIVPSPNQKDYKAFVNLIQKEDNDIDV